MVNGPSRALYLKGNNLFFLYEIHLKKDCPCPAKQIEIQEDQLHSFIARRGMRLVYKFGRRAYA